MIFVQEFDVKPGVSGQEIKDTFFAVAAKWEEIWPTNRLLGLFERRFIGSGSSFLAMWEMPNFAAFDEWNGAWPGVKENDFVALENELWAKTSNMTSRTMERCKISE